MTNTPSLIATDQLGAAGATHPRVSLEDIEAAIHSTHYVTGEEALIGGSIMPDAATCDALHVLTICLIVMKNGFVIIGKSAPASPENFDREKGRTFAREDAIRQLWPLMGFALREELRVQRLIEEADAAAPVLPELRRLIIAARKVADEISVPPGDEDGEAALTELDQAAEAYAGLVPWENEDEAAPTNGD